MTKYLLAIIKSFYSPEVYRDAILEWKGFAGKYISLLAVFLAIIIGIGFYMALFQFDQKELEHITKQLPPITITDGVVSVAEKQPVTVQNVEKNFTIIIDTSKSPSELRATKSQMAVGKDFMLLQTKDNTYQTVDLSSIKGQITINDKNIHKFFAMFKAIAVPLLWFGQFISLVVKIFIVTILSYVVTAFMREEYDFMVRMRLSVLALTPPVLISTAIVLAFNHEVAPWFFMLVACLYIYVMIVLMRRIPAKDAGFTTII